MSNRQIPRGSETLICPLHKATMETVCHKCPWWTQVRGKHPQSNEEIDRWDCAISFLPMLLIENAQMQRQTGAAVESFRNEMKRSHDASLALASAEASFVKRVIAGEVLASRLIEGRADGHA